MTEEEDKNKQLAVLAAGLFLIVAIIVIYWLFEKYLKDSSLEEFDSTRHAEYCKNVHLYMQTDGKEGWPDFRGIYYKDCVGKQVKGRR